MNETRKTNSLALASLIIGIVCIVIPFLPIIPPLLAIIFGFMALGQLKDKKEEGKGLAIAGIIMGFVSIFVTIIFGLILLFSIAAFTGALEQLSNDCAIRNGFDCDASLDNGMLTLKITNSRDAPLDGLTVMMEGYCYGEQPLGNLNPGEERAVVFPCARSSLQAGFAVLSGGAIETTGTIDI